MLEGNTVNKLFCVEKVHSYCIVSLVIGHSCSCLQVCAGTDNNFVVINQKGIDPPSLDILARAGVSDPFSHRAYTPIFPSEICSTSALCLLSLSLSLA